METIQNKTTNKIVGIKNAGWVIICCFIIAVCVYHFILGNPSNFMNNDPNNHPLPGSFLGTIYKGGVVVPIIQTLLLTVIALSVERYLAIRSAFGRGSLVKFVANIKSTLAAGDMKKAQELCDKQGGSVANVVTSTLRKYADVENDATLSKDQKVLAIQKEFGRSNCTGAPYDGAESACYRYNHHIGYLDGTTRYGNWYDPFICSFVCRWWYGLHGFVTRYFRGVDQYGIRYLDRCIGGYFL